MAFNWQGLEREVVLKRTAIVAVVTAALHLVVAAHWLTFAQSATVIKDVTAAIDFLGVSAGALFSRAGVSPVRQGSVADLLDVPVTDLASPASDAPVIVEARNPNSTV
jgi:hypothetical protein